MTLWELLSLIAGTNWFFAVLLAGMKGGPLGIAIGLVLGLAVGVAIVVGTNRAGYWLIVRYRLDESDRIVLPYLLLVAAIAWILFCSFSGAVTMRGVLRLVKIGRAHV